MGSAVGRELVIEVAEPTEPVLFRSADQGTLVVAVMPFLLASDLR